MSGEREGLLWEQATYAGLAIWTAVTFVLITFVVGFLTASQPLPLLLKFPALWIVVIALLSFVRIKVAIHSDRVDYTFGVWGWPTRSIAIRDIRGVRPDVLNPLPWMGWGYRVRPGRKRAIVLRKGEALVLETQDRELWITVDRSDEAGSIVNELIRTSRESV